MLSQDQKYEPGNEPISTDELLLQIGEKEVDLLRKRRAIGRLSEQIQILLKANEELNIKLLQYEKNESFEPVENKI